MSIRQLPSPASYSRCRIMGILFALILTQSIMLGAVITVHTIHANRIVYCSVYHHLFGAISSACSAHEDACHVSLTLFGDRCLVIVNSYRPIVPRTLTSRAYVIHMAVLSDLPIDDSPEIPKYGKSWCHCTTRQQKLLMTRDKNNMKNHTSTPKGGKGKQLPN